MSAATVIIDLTGDEPVYYPENAGVIPEPMDLEKWKEPESSELPELDSLDFRYDPVPEAVASDVVITLRPAQDAPAYDGPNPFATTPNGPISVILGWLPFSDFLKSRLVCSRFNEVAKKTPSQWKEFLAEKGPKQIGEHSFHRTDQWIDTRKCKIGKFGKCNVVAHYERKELTPKFNEDDHYAPFRTTLDYLGNRKETKIRNRVNAHDKTATRLDDQITRIGDGWGEYYIRRLIIRRDHAKSRKRRSESNLNDVVEFYDATREKYGMSKKRRRKTIKKNKE